MFGKILSLPFRIANIPFRAVEKLVGKMGGQDDIQKENRILSKPLECVVEAIEEIDNKKAP